MVVCGEHGLPVAVYGQTVMRALTAGVPPGVIACPEMAAPTCATALHGIRLRIKAARNRRLKALAALLGITPLVADRVAGLTVIVHDPIIAMACVHASAASMFKGTFHQ